MRRRQKGLNFYRRRKKISSGLIKEIFSWIFGVFTAVFMAAVLVIAFGLQTSMIGNSMEPELYNGQQVFINRFTYKLSSPKRGDVICFLPNGNQNSHYYVKRVVGLPVRSYRSAMVRFILMVICWMKTVLLIRWQMPELPPRRLLWKTGSILCWGITVITVRTVVLPI